MSSHDTIVVGASAGGVETLKDLARLLPLDIPAAIFVVVHFPPYGISTLPRILSRAGPLPAAHAVDGEPIRHGRIYVAFPDHHLLVHKGHVELSRGPKENRARPAIDPLFRSAAVAYGPRVTGVILSGALSDGTLGLAEVEKRGGVTIAQDPREASFASMPLNAIQRDHVDHILPVSKIAALMVRLAKESVMARSSNPRPDNKESANNLIHGDLADQIKGERHGMPATYTCPECGGNLWEVRDQGATAFQCHTGHTLTPENLLAQQSEMLEHTLWAALRRTIEKATLLRQMAQAARRQLVTGSSPAFEDRMASRLETEAEAVDRDASELRKVIQNMAPNHTGEHEDEAAAAE